MGDSAVFWETFLPFCFVLPGLKFFLSLYNFPDTYATPLATLPGYTPCMDTPPVKYVTHMAIPLKKTCVLFTSGNKWTSCDTAFPLRHRPVYSKNRRTSCHVTHATYVACQRNHVTIQQHVLGKNSLAEIIPLQVYN